MMNVLAKDLNWNHKTKRGIAEASSLFGKEVPRLFNAYNGDTNKVASFVRDHEIREENPHEIGDILAWVFRPTQDTLDRHPSLKGWMATIVND